MKSELCFRETRVSLHAVDGKVFMGVVHPIGNVMPELGVEQAELLAAELLRTALVAKRQRRARQAAWFCIQAERKSHARA